MPFELNTKPTPQKIHFIWLGGPIYPKYLKSIQGVAELAKIDGYEINLWVDNERNYYKTADQEQIHIPNLRIRKIREELYANQIHDPFYLGNDPDFSIKKDEATNDDEEKPGDRSKHFQSYVERELVGFKNFAAAADLLRLEILRQEGGWYFDTDTYFPNINPPFPPKLQQTQVGNLTPEQKIKKYNQSYLEYLDRVVQYNQTHVPVFPVRPLTVKNPPETYAATYKERHKEMFSLLKERLLTIKKNAWSTNQTQPIHEHFDNQEILQLGIAVHSAGCLSDPYDENGNLSKTSLSLINTNNDILGAVEDSFCIKSMILDAMKYYKDLDEKVLSKEYSPGKRNDNFSEMDAKRYPKEFGRGLLHRLYGRRSRTIDAAGPGVIARVVNKIWPEAVASINNRSDLTAKKKAEFIEESASSLLIKKDYGHDCVSSAAGIKVESIYDMTWLEKKKLSSLDAESIDAESMNWTLGKRT